MPYFPDSLIVNVQVGPRRLVLRMRDVTADDDSFVTGTLGIEGVTEFQDERQPADYAGFGLGFDDGQILHLAMDEHSIDLIVEWDNYALRRKRTAVYRIVGDRVYWKQDPG